MCFQGLLHFSSDILSCLSLHADLNKNAQIPQLRELPSILISTPTRLVEHLKEGNIDLKKTLKILIIDEADLVLSYGYEEDVKQLLDYLPKVHQSLLFSATLSPEVDALRSLVLHSPKIVKMEERQQSTEELLKQLYISCSDKDKYVILYAFLKLKVIAGKVHSSTQRSKTSIPHNNKAKSKKQLPDTYSCSY